MASNYRIGLLDIENSPCVSYTWGAYDQDVLAFKEDWYIMAAAWKWHDEKTTTGLILPDFKSYKKNPKNDEELVEACWKWLDEADLVIGHNHVAFDLRKLNARFAFHKMKPPSPYKTVDTLKLAQRYFAFPKNKLKDLAEYLDVEHKKIDPGGFELWKLCMAGDLAAYEKMRKYNRRDVVTLEEVYERLRGWHVHHPNVNMNDNPHTYKCPNCASPDVQRKGWNNAIAYRSQRYLCNNCGRSSSGTKEKIPGRLLR